MTGTTYSLLTVFAMSGAVTAWITTKSLSLTQYAPQPNGKGTAKEAKARP